MLCFRKFPNARKAKNVKVVSVTVRVQAVKGTLFVIGSKAADGSKQEANMTVNLVQNNQDRKLNHIAEILMIEDA